MDHEARLEQRVRSLRRAVGRDMRAQTAKARAAFNAKFATPEERSEHFRRLAAASARVRSLRRWQ